MTRPQTCHFATLSSPLRHGGLVICGLNWGLPRGAQPTLTETSYSPWADYFSHPGNHDRFSGRVKRWFALWGHPLSPDNPTMLDHAISQTNLFYTATQSFDLGAVHALRMTQALSRLFSGVSHLDASGLLLTCSRIAPALTAFLSLASDAWQWQSSGRMNVAFAETERCRIAICPHPRFPVAYRDAEELAPSMSEWIGNVMNEYKQRQAEQTPPAYPEGRADAPLGSAEA